jgi:hypothetical protein
VDNVGQAGDVVVALLDDAESKDREVHADDASADGLPLALTSAAGAVAGVAVAEEEADTGGVHDTLLHRETLLVVAAGDLDDVALELVADAVGWDFLTHAAVHEDAELALIVDLDQLLGAIVGVGDVELHLDCGVSTACGSCNVSRLSWCCRIHDRNYQIGPFASVVRANRFRGSHVLARLPGTARGRSRPIT